MLRSFVVFLVLSSCPVRLPVSDVLWIIPSLVAVVIPSLLVWVAPRSALPGLLLAWFVIVYPLWLLVYLLPWLRRSRAPVTVRGQRESGNGGPVAVGYDVSEGHRKHGAVVRVLGALFARRRDGLPAGKGLSDGHVREQSLVRPRSRLGRSRRTRRRF